MAKWPQQPQTVVVHHLVLRPWSNPCPPSDGRSCLTLQSCKAWTVVKAAASRPRSPTLRFLLCDIPLGMETTTTKECADRTGAVKPADLQILNWKCVVSKRVQWISWRFWCHPWWRPKQRQVRHCWILIIATSQLQYQMLVRMLGTCAFAAWNNLAADASIPVTRPTAQVCFWQGEWKHPLAVSELDWEPKKLVTLLVICLRNSCFNEVSKLFKEVIQSFCVRKLKFPTSLSKIWQN